MGSWIRRQGPTFAIACLALMVALGGSVYAASKIDGRTIKAESLPGNRVEPPRCRANRLQPGTLRGSRIAPGSLTGAQVDAATLGKVPEAAHADSAASGPHRQHRAARRQRRDAASGSNGHSAGCTVDPAHLFAGACWELQASAGGDGAARRRLSARPAAASCRARWRWRLSRSSRGSSWRRKVSGRATSTEYLGANAYCRGHGVAMRKSTPHVSTAIRPFRCVIPLVS